MSAPADQFYGVNFHWALGGTTITVTNATGVYQNARYSTPMDKLETKNQRGIFNGVQYINGVEKLTLEWLASDSSAASGSAAVTSPAVGTSVTITSDGAWTGTGWKVDSIDVGYTNTANTTVTGQFTRYGF